MYSVEFFAGAIGFSRGIPFRISQVAARLGFNGAISLRTVMTRPRLPTSLSPVGTGAGSGISITSVGLAWQDTGVPGYNQATRFILSLSPNNGSTIPEILSPQTTYTIPYNLRFGQDYQWSVQSVNDHGSSAISNAAFRTISPPRPTNLAPNNVDTVLVPVVLSWVDPGAAMGSAAIRFEIKMYGLFDSPGVLGSKIFDCQQPNFTVPINLFGYEHYTWSVKSCFALPLTSIDNWSAPSDAQFTTLGN
jgi:hypothetical protein